MSLVDSFEKIPVSIFDNDKNASVFVAREISNLIRQKQKEGTTCVLGLATGSTPKTLYGELIKLHKNEGLSFKNVITFNLDEYYPIEPEALQSYNRFMKVHLFNHIDIDPTNTHVPDGTIEKADVRSYAATYEKKIELAGGIDLQILGIILVLMSQDQAVIQVRGLWPLIIQHVLPMRMNSAVFRRFRDWRSQWESILF